MPLYSNHYQWQYEPSWWYDTHTHNTIQPSIKMISSGNKTHTHTHTIHLLLRTKPILGANFDTTIIVTLHNQQINKTMNSCPRTNGPDRATMGSFVRARKPGFGWCVYIRKKTHNRSLAHKLFWIPDRMVFRFYLSPGFLNQIFPSIFTMKFKVHSFFFGSLCLAKMICEYECRVKFVYSIHFFVVVVVVQSHRHWNNQMKWIGTRE